MLRVLTQLKRIFNARIVGKGSLTYSQCGEDRILLYLFKSLGINKPSYLDLGASHPIRANNTYLFYTLGASGVCVDADFESCRSISRVRKRDKCIHVGVTFDDRREADFFVFSNRGLSTLSREEAEYRSTHGSYRVVNVEKINLKTINELIAENFSSSPDFLSIDLEGIDFQVIQSMDFSKYRPTAICVETITYSETRQESKLVDLEKYILSQNYVLYADTHINSIFVDRKRFEDSSVIIKPW